jgi:hypothetical protein
MSGDIGVDAVDPAEHVRAQELVMVGEMPVERSAQLILLLYLDKRGRPKVRIHGRPRSDRKRRFLLSAVAPSTSTRHPREARPINWAQRGGLASGRGRCLLTPRPHFTAHHARLVTRWLLLRTALLFVRSAVRLVYAELPGPVAVCLPKQALCGLGDRVQVATASLSTVESSPRRPHRLLPHRATPATVYQARPKQTPAPSCNLGGGPTDVRILVAARRRGLSSRRSPSLSSLTTTLPVMAQIDIEYAGRTYTVPWTDDNVERLKGFAQHVRDGRAEVFTVLGDGFALTIVVGPTIPVAISYVD